MKVCFWISLGAILFVYVGYPLGIALLARCFPRRWKRAPWPLDSQPRPVSIHHVNVVVVFSPIIPTKIIHPSPNSVVVQHI